MKLGEKKIVSIDSQKEIPGFDLISSILLRDNGIDPNDFEKLFPDIGLDKKLTIYDYLENYFVPMKETETFIDFILENFDKKICLITDYDVDGIMSTIIMKMGLNYIGIKDVMYHIPKRIHSYGLSVSLIDRALSNGAEVIITADNGIGAKEAVEYALSKGLKVLVTDHHIPVEGNVPDNVPIIAPAYNDDEFIGICGANVCFKLIFELLKRFVELKEPNMIVDDFISEMVVYAAIATVSDLMPMLQENRLLLSAALNYVNDLKSMGYIKHRIYQFLMSFGGRFALNDPKQLFDEGVIAFSVSPCLNSISRLGHSVEETVGEIIDGDYRSIYKKNYYGMNKERQRRTKVLSEKHVRSNDPVSLEVINADDFDFEIAGLVGLAVNRITSEENKPGLMGTYQKVKDENGDLKIDENGEPIEKYSFSARSTLGYSIHDGVNRVKELAPELKIEGGETVTPHLQKCGLK